MVAVDTTRWHHKWVVFVLMLGWLFLYRYRIMSYLLSKAIAYQLLKFHLRDPKRARITARVERVSLQPLRLFKLELSCHGSTTWRIVFTRVEVQSHVKAFFESFGLVKICILMIDEVVGNVDQIDDKLLQDLLMPKKMVARNTSQMRPRMNPICYLRFVDLKVQNIRLCVNCMKITTTFMCHGLYVGITDVSVTRDLLQIEVQTKSMIFHSVPQIDMKISTNPQSDGSDGLRIKTPETAAVISLNLRDKSFLGCNVTGCDEQTTTLVMATAFLERALAARNDVIRTGVLAACEVLADGSLSGSKDSLPMPTTPSEVGLNCFRLSLTLVNEEEPVYSVPIHLFADISKVYYRKQLEPWNDANHTKEAITVTTDNVFRIQVEASVQSVRVHNLVSNHRLLTVCCIEVQAKQTARTCGVLMVAIQNIDLSISPYTEKNLCSLIAAHKRLVRSQGEVHAMLNLPLKQQTSLLIDGRRVLQKNESRIHWESQTKVMNWLLSYKACAKDDSTHDLTATGSVTLIQTPLAPFHQTNGFSFTKRSLTVQHVSVEVAPSGLSPCSASFGGVELALAASVAPLELTKTLEMSIRVEFVSVNGLRSEHSNDVRRFPALCMYDFSMGRTLRDTTEVSEVAWTMHMEKIVVKWHYPQQENLRLEWAAIKTLIDQFELLLLKSKTQTRPRISSMHIVSRDTLLHVLDIPGVAPLATFCLVETKVSHRVTQLCALTALNAANLSVRWGDKPSMVTFTHASFQHRSSRGRQRYLSKVPMQSDIRCSSIKVQLCPYSQMLLLALRLEQLISHPSSDKGNGSTRHGISFISERLSLEMIESHENTGSLDLTSLDIKLTRCKPREITETIIRLAQCLQKDGLAGRSFAEVAQQVHWLEGTASASTISVAIPLKKLIEVQNTEIHFAITDVEWSQCTAWEDGSILPRTTTFDLSMVTEKIDATFDKKSFNSVLCLLPILQQAFETKLSPMHKRIVTVSKQPSFRQRFVGHIDLAFHNAELIYPHDTKDNREQQSKSNQTRVRIGEMALNLRQFQTLGFRCSPLRVLLESADIGESSNRHADSLQLLYVPKISASGAIHWQHSIHGTASLQYALSLEIAIGHTHVYNSPTHVPVVDDALVSLNWDCVVPWVFDMIIDDTSDHLVERAGKESSSTKQVQCVGVQWDLSVHAIQVVWWDTATQEIGMLIVANKFLTHGVSRIDNASDLEHDWHWKLWEATIYLHLFRGYLLHNPDDFHTIDKATPVVCPFRSEMASNFSVETLGTNYRNSYTPRADEDWEALDDEITAMFAPSTVTMFDKMHDGFAPIDYDFSVVYSINRAQTEPSMKHLPMLHVPVSVRMSSAASSRPKSPRSAKNWTQKRVLRLKHRSASMDNLFQIDGSCPIQVDAMRLLWTLQTRDSVFYMVSTTANSFRLLMDAKRNAEAEDGQHRTARPASLSPLRRANGNNFRSPSIVATNPEVGHRDTIASRQGTAQDTLLELLQQGKLGMAQEDCDLPSKSIDEETKSTRDSLNEDDTKTCNATRALIISKAYTIDIHDVQINVREENTRSNVLLASKRIHFEIGTDASDMNTIATLTFDRVTAHVAPIDVDISASVLWYSHANVGSPLASGSSLLKQIMDECSLTSAYTHTQSTGATSTEVDLSFLELSTDRHQFYQLMNVIRHVLLAPPSVARRTKRPVTSRANSTESLQHLEGTDTTDWIPVSPTTPTVAGFTSTKKLHVLLEEELRHREIRTRGTMSRSKWAMTALKAISFKVVGMQWKLRLSPELAEADHEFVGIRIRGFTGCHSFFTNHWTKLTLTLQWLEIINLRPGPSSAAFEDSTAVLKAKLLVDKRLESTNVGIQKGMLVVRAESGPIVRVYGQKLRVLEVLEVSMFPEVANMIVIQLAADFYELIYKFLFEHISPTPASSQTSELFFGRKSTYGPVSSIASSSVSTLSLKGVSASFGKSRAPQPTGLSPKPLSAMEKSNSAGSTHSTLTDSSNLNMSQTSCEEVPDESESSAADDCELFYVKYVRVGNVRLRINCNGFFMNLSHFDLELPPYVCQSKLCTSKQLLQKFESHLKWYITKESASSGLSQFKNKLLKWTPSSSTIESTKDKNSKKQEEDMAAANAQVLFGPYSGT